ncbi:MAG: hypothetical protein ABI811_18275 [Acidobacteriota bacterium]
MPTANILVAAEKREFAGLLRRIPHQLLPWPNAAFAHVSGSRILLANGAGPRSIQQLFQEISPDEKFSVTCIVSTGFCGALDTSLKIGDIVVDGGPIRTSLPYIQGKICSIDHVVVTAEEKRQLRERTGATVVEMEFAAVQAVALKWGVPCQAIRVVSDTAGEDLPLDFNLYRDADGRFQLPRIAMSGLLSPFRVLPALLRLDRNSREASEKLGAFLAHCEF